MNNKIGFKSKAYKSENYAPVLVQKPKEETEYITLEDAMQDVGYRKAIQLITEYLLTGSLPAHAYVGQQLYEIKKRFFEPI